MDEPGVGVRRVAPGRRPGRRATRHQAGGFADSRRRQRAGARARSRRARRAALRGVSGWAARAAERGDEAGLIRALRSNLRLLGEIAARYGIDAPAKEADAPAARTRQEAERLLGTEMRGLAQEQIRVLLLDNDDRVIGWRVALQGNAYGVVAKPAEVLRPAVAAAAPRVVLLHNHPSGDPEPSATDLGVTRNLADACDLLGIELVDHVVVGARGSVSLRERGLL